MSPVFNNFDLHIGQGTNGIYPVSVQYSPAGETASPVLVKIVHDSSIDEWLEDLQDRFTKEETLQALGRRPLLTLLPFGPVRDLYQRSLGRGAGGIFASSSAHFTLRAGCLALGVCLQ